MDLDNLIFSNHSKDRMVERGIEISWIRSTLENYNDFQEVTKEKNIFLKTISENGDRCLKVIFNPLTNTVISSHFDRGLKKRGCKF